MERNSRKLIRMLERDGWILDRINGDHHTYKHPSRNVIITVTHPRRDLPTGLVRLLQTGWLAALREFQNNVDALCSGCGKRD
jgi:predicted RNA binding protein YcfA (HicA-like mRNA interferase family)